MSAEFPTRCRSLCGAPSNDYSSSYSLNTNFQEETKTKGLNASSSDGLKKSGMGTVGQLLLSPRTPARHDLHEVLVPGTSKQRQLITFLSDQPNWTGMPCGGGVSGCDWPLQGVDTWPPGARPVHTTQTPCRIGIVIRFAHSISRLCFQDRLVFLFGAQLVVMLSHTGLRKCARAACVANQKSLTVEPLNLWARDSHPCMCAHCEHGKHWNTS